MTAESLARRYPGLGQTLDQESEKGVHLFFERAQKLMGLSRDLCERAWQEFDKPRWEAEVFGFPPDTLPENPLYTHALAAILRAHQDRNPKPEGFYEIVSPGCLLKRKPEYRLVDVPTIDQPNLPDSFKSFLKRAQTTGVFATEAIQLANIIARLQKLSPEEIHDRTVQTILACFRPDGEISMVKSNHPPLPVILGSVALTIPARTFDFLTGKEQPHWIDFWGHKHRYLLIMLNLLKGW